MDADQPEGVPFIYPDEHLIWQMRGPAGQWAEGYISEGFPSWRVITNTLNRPFRNVCDTATEATTQLMETKERYVALGWTEHDL